MIVVSIVAFLVTLVLYPYAYYMKRSYVERSRDTLGQEWILAHKNIRNGKLFSTNKHANTVLIFKKWVWWVEEYLLSWWVIPPMIDFERNTTNPNIKFDSFFAFDQWVQIVSARGFDNASSEEKIGYFIQAPYASGAFFTGSSMLFSSTGIFLSIGYNQWQLENGHAREILLRPYLQ